jgi:hypothetical protein
MCMCVCVRARVMQCLCVRTVLCVSVCEKKKYLRASVAIMYWSRSKKKHVLEGVS